MALPLPPVGDLDDRLQFNFDRIAEQFPLGNITGLRTVIDYGADRAGVRDSTAAFQKAINAGGWKFIPAGTYKITSALNLTTSGVKLIGEGSRKSVLQPAMSSGYCIDVQTSGFHRFQDFGIDGTNATSSARALRLGRATSRNELYHVQISGFLGSNVFTTRMEGSLDNTFVNCDWENNQAHIQVGESSDHAYPSNENTFLGCKFQTVRWASGSAVEVLDSEGNRFENCLFQSNEGLFTVSIGNTSTGAAPGRINQVRGCWFEQNGNNQTGSHHIHVAGNASGAPVISTVIRDNMLNAAGPSWPQVMVYLNNADQTYIDGNYSNWGTPNIAVQHAAGVTSTRFGANNFAGDFNGTAIVGHSTDSWWKT